MPLLPKIFLALCFLSAPLPQLTNHASYLSVYP